MQQRPVQADGVTPFDTTQRFGNCRPSLCYALPLRPSDWSLGSLRPKTHFIRLSNTSVEVQPPLVYRGAIRED